MSEFAPKFAFSGKIPFDSNPKIGGFTPSDIYSGKAGKIDYNPFSGGSSSGGGFDYGAFSQKNPKTAGFLDGFMQARGLKGGGSGTQGGGDSSGQAKMLGGMGGTMSQLASGLTEQRDPFYMLKTGGKFIPGKKGFGQVALEAGVGAIGGFMTGGPAGAVGGTLGSLSQNANQI